MNCCSNCIYVHKAEHIRTRQISYECRRHAPVVVLISRPVSSRDTRSVWPEVEANDKCGEYKGNFAK